MEIRQLGKTGLRVSKFCLGAMTFGQPGWGCDESEAAKIMGAFLDAGGNFVDTADSYSGGRSEEILGRLVRAHRSEVVIASKVGNATGTGPNGRGLSRGHILDALHASLRRLDTEYIDLYQLHYFDQATPLEETLDVLADCVRVGKVRYIGCSNFFGWQLGLAAGRTTEAGRPPIASCQMMYNLVRRDLERDHFSACQALGIGLITYSPLHSGVLASCLRSDGPAPPGSRVSAHPRIRAVYLDDAPRVDQVVDALGTIAEKYGITPSDLSLGWVLRQPAITSVLTGVQSADELTKNLAVMNLQVDDIVWDELDHATALAPSYPSDFYTRLPWTLKLVTD
jgi:1-deoxyxylulose-5-phosphate synthase